jgi:hypothetical protein
MSASPSFAPNRSKSDNFKVRELDQPPPPPQATLTVQKFYDANADGVRNNGEVLLTGLAVHLTAVHRHAGDACHDVRGAARPRLLHGDGVDADAGNWYATTAVQQSVTSLPARRSRSATSAPARVAG